MGFHRKEYYVEGRFGRFFLWHQHPDCSVEAASDLILERRNVLMESCKLKLYKTKSEFVF